MFATFIILPIIFKSQSIANYVNNGGFEVLRTSNTQKAKFWDSIDTTKFLGLVYSATVNPYLVPLSSLTYQWPKGGSNYFITTLLYKPYAFDELRGYPRNILKQNLQTGRTYCVKLFYNVTNQSPYAVDALGIYFGDTTLDTISQCDKPITYLNPQIQHSSGFITDTLNWVALTGTFVANGSEKYMMIGNFKSDSQTNTLIINPTNSLVIASDIIFDNISCIDIDLPANAGSDAWILPGDSVFIGRQPDVGINEACMWYKMPNITTAIDTVAGLWVKPSVTSTYIVKQEICAGVKYDTVVIHISAVGLDEKSHRIEYQIFPNPTSEYLELQFYQPTENLNYLIENINGQIIQKDILEITNQKARIALNINEGIYLLKIKNKDKTIAVRKLAVIK